MFVEQVVDKDDNEENITDLPYWYFTRERYIRRKAVSCNDGFVVTVATMIIMSLARQRPKYKSPDQSGDLNDKYVIII